MGPHNRHARDEIARNSAPIAPEQETCDNRAQRRGCDGTHRNIARKRNEHGKNAEQLDTCRRRPPAHEQCANGHSDALAAVKAQPRAENMAQGATHRRYAKQGFITHEATRQKRRRTHANEARRDALAEIEQEHRGAALFAHRAHGVRGANIAAAMLANIGVVKHLGNNETPRN